MNFYHLKEKIYDLYKTWFYIIKSNFKELYNNIIKIFFSFQISKIILFLILLPLCYNIIRIQIYIGLIFFCWYCILIIIYYFLLKINYIIDCKEIPLNYSRLILYSIFHIFIFIPKNKSFVILYQILKYTKKKEKTDKIIIIILILIFIPIFIIKITLLIFLGYSYISLLITSNIIIKIFDLTKLKYDSNKALFETIILNCFVFEIESIEKAETMRIIITENEIILNPNECVELLEKIFKKFKKIDVLYKAFNINHNKIFYKTFLNNHFTFTMLNQNNLKNSIATNFTSSKYIDVLNKETTLKKECKNEIKPNILGEEKPNYLTPIYEIDLNKYVLCAPNIKYTTKMSQLTRTAYKHLLENLNEEMLVLKENKIEIHQLKISVKGYLKEFNFEINDNLNYLEEFENINKEILETKEGKIDYEILKSYLNNYTLTKIEDIWLK